MFTSNRIVLTLAKMIDSHSELRGELLLCFRAADWTPPGWREPIGTFDHFYDYLNQLLDTTPAEATFDNLFHGIFYIVSQDDNKLQQDERFSGFQEWLTVYVEVYGSIMNTAGSANSLNSFLKNKTFVIEDFEISPGGFNCFNAFFSRHIKPGKRPIGTQTFAYIPPSEGQPVAPNPTQIPELIHQNMCDDNTITVPADSVFKGCWPISEESTINVSKGNTYSIKTLLEGSKYADRFRNGLFTHSYLTVFTYHRYHTPVRGKVLEKKVISGQVFADVVKKENGDLSAKDGTGYQFKQDRGLIVLDSPVGLVALLPIGMDFISSCNFSVDEGDYLNKGDEFGYFLFGGSDMIMLFERNDIDVQLQQKDMLYKLGQVFAKANKNKS